MSRSMRGGRISRWSCTFFLFSFFSFFLGLVFGFRSTPLHKSPIPFCDFTVGVNTTPHLCLRLVGEAKVYYTTVTENLPVSCFHWNHFSYPTQRKRWPRHPASRLRHRRIPRRLLYAQSASRVWYRPLYASPAPVSNPPFPISPLSPSPYPSTHFLSNI
jgi:hypothetical protein